MKKVGVIIAIIIAVIITIFCICKLNKKEEKNEVAEEVKTVIESEAIATEIEEIPAVVQSTEPVPAPTPLETTYKGFNVAGKITIPKTGVDTPFLDRVTVNGMEVAPCLLLQSGELNVSGNAYIVGHNYMNGTLFSDNGKLEVGDKIIITAMDGTEKEYTIYNKFVTTPEDTSFLKRELSGAEITLQSCTDDEEGRIIILAK